MKTILKKELKLKKDPGDDTWSLDASFFPNVACQHTNCILFSQDSPRINNPQASSSTATAVNALVIWCRECGALKIGNAEFKLPESEK